MINTQFATSSPLATSVPSLPKHEETPTALMMGSHPTCDLCQTDDYLVFELVRVVIDTHRFASPVWELEFWCGQCETFYGFRTVHPPRDRRVVESALKRTTQSSGVDAASHF